MYIGYLQANVGTRTEEGQYEKIWETKESKLNTSDNNGDENSGGPFNQVIICQTKREEQNIRTWETIAT